MSEEEYQTELKRHFVLNHLMNELKQMKIDEMKNISKTQKQKIDMAVAQVHVNELVKLDPKHGPLGKKNNFQTQSIIPFQYTNYTTGVESKPIELSYTEKAAVKEHLPKQVAKSIEKSVEFSHKFNEKILNPKILTDKIVELETNRQQLQNDLKNAKVQAVDKMKECAEMKFGSRQENAAKLLEEKSAVQEIKAL